MESPQQEGQPEEGTALTSFDRATADAVVAVLTRAGIPTWQGATPDDHGDTVVMVPPGQREHAMREMGQRMEEIQAALAGRSTPNPVATVPVTPDDARSGPPLVMERFADLRVVVVVILAPLLAITIAGPFLPRGLRQVIFVVMAAAVVGIIWRRRNR